MSKPRLQRAGPDAVPEIIALLTRAVPGCSPQTVWNVPWSWSDYWLLCDDHELLATGALQLVDQDRCELRGLAVDPKHRGRGFARRMLTCLTDVAHGRGQDLLCVTRQPEFFRRFGFSETHPFWLDVEPSRQPAVDAKHRVSDANRRVPMVALHDPKEDTTMTLQRRKDIPHEGLDIRPATFGEMGLVADFVRSSADWYRPIVDEKDMGQHEVGGQWAKDNFALRDFYIGHEGDTPIGTISIQYLGDWAYLGYIYLDVEHVGKGYGRRLIEFASGIARRSGARGMTLIAHPEATWAKKAYLKYGFRIVERDRERVLSWQDGALRPYYEEGFELYMYEFSDRHGGRRPISSPELVMEAAQ